MSIHKSIAQKKDLQTSMLAGKPIKFWRTLIKNKDYAPIKKPPPQVRVEITRLPPQQLQTIKDCLTSSSEGLARGTFKSISRRNFQYLHEKDKVEIMKVALGTCCLNSVNEKAAPLISTFSGESRLELIKAGLMEIREVVVLPAARLIKTVDKKYWPELIGLALKSLTHGEEIATIVKPLIKRLDKKDQEKIITDTEGHISDYIRYSILRFLYFSS